MPITNVARVSDWNVERGFGFAIANGKRYFVHKTALGPIARDPKVGDTIIVTQFLETPKGSRISSGVLEGVALKPLRMQNEYNSSEGGSILNKRVSNVLIYALVALALLLLRFCANGDFAKIRRLAHNEPVPQTQTVEPVHNTESVPKTESAPEAETFHEPFYDDYPTEKETRGTSDSYPQYNSGSQFKCDGRVYCSQMRSYEEAVFFLNNCPGTKMDGDHDGIPCERQFGR